MALVNFSPEKVGRNMASSADVPWADKVRGERAWYCLFTVPAWAAWEARRRPLLLTVVAETRDPSRSTIPPVTRF